jgi:hypothetical protein
MVEGVVLEAEAPLVVGVLRLGGYVDRKGVCREGVTLVWEQKVEMESESLTKVGASPVMSTSGITTSIEGAMGLAAMGSSEQLSSSSL